MSDFIPAQPRPNSVRHSGLGLWLLMSAVAHAAAIGWLLKFAPAHAVDIGQGGPGAPTAGQMQRAMAQVRKQQADTHRTALRQLRDARAQMAQLEQAKRAEFLQDAKDSAKSASARIQEARAAVAEAQALALRALDDAAQASAKTSSKDLVNQYALVTAAQVRAAEAQQRILDQLDVSAGPGHSAVLDQRAATAAQDQATKAAAAAADAARRTAGERVKSSDAPAAASPAEVTRAEEQLQTAKAALPTLTRAMEEADAKVKAAAAAQSAAEQQVAGNVNAEAAVQSATKSELKTAQKSVATARKKLADAKSKFDRAVQKVAAAQAKVDQVAAVGNSSSVPVTATLPEAGRVTPNPDAAKSVQAQARALQVAAQAAQAKADTSFSEAAIDQAKPDAAAAASAAAAEALAQLDQASPQSAVTAATENPKDLASIYASAVQNEAAITESYRRLRAMELSMTRRIPLQRALDLTDVARTVRPDLKAALARPATSPTDLQQSKDAIEASNNQMTAMQQLARSLVTEAKALDHTAGTTVSVESRNDRYDRLAAMSAQASEDRGWASDVSTLMRSDPGVPGSARGTGQAGSAGAAAAGLAGTGDAGGNNGSQPGGATGRVGGAGQSIGKGGPSIGNGGFGGAGNGEGFGWPFGGHGPGTSALTSAREQNLPMYPGRRFAVSGTSPDWVYVDSWYLLGPFDNTGRANLERQFPPETVVDLNAVYPGKEGVPIRWEFFQASRPNISPPLEGFNRVHTDPRKDADANHQANLQYIIYYGYTELYFEQACDLWIAVGSDDFSKMWIDDQLVWSSGTKTKPWRIDEGARKVHLKQGINRVLVRVENAYSRTAFSLIIGMKTDRNDAR